MNLHLPLLPALVVQKNNFLYPLTFHTLVAQAFDACAIIYFFEIFNYLEKMPLNATPMQRWGEVKDVAPLVAFLCCQESGFITGENLKM